MSKTVSKRADSSGLVGGGVAVGGILAGFVSAVGAEKTGVNPEIMTAASVAFTGGLMYAINEGELKHAVGAAVAAGVIIYPFLMAVNNVRDNNIAAQKAFAEAQAIPPLSYTLPAADPMCAGADAGKTYPITLANGRRAELVCP